MKAFARIFAAVLVFAVLFSGCGRAMEAKDPGNLTVEENTAPAPQEEMPREELKAALKRLEYSAIAAAVAAEEERHFFENGCRNPITVYIGDLDGDQDEEMVFGWNAFVMDSSEGELLQYSWSESGARYYTDPNGLFYRETGKSADYEYRRGYEYDPDSDDCWPLPDHLDSAWAVSIAEWYDTWDGAKFTGQFTYSRSSLTESMGFSEEQEPFYKEESIEFASGEKLEDEAAVAYLEGLSLQPVETTARDFTVNSFDSKYQQSICQALDGYFREGYGSYGGCVTADVDDDGQEEQVFLLPGLLSPWEDSVRQQAQSDMFQSDMFDWVSDEFDLKQPRTAVLLADRQDDRVVFRAGCVFGDYRPDSGSSARLEGFLLNVDGVGYPLDSLLIGTRIEELYPQFAAYLNAQGYREPVFLRADLTDMDGEDLICLCQKDGTWYILIICVVDGYPVPLMQRDTSTTACYLVQVDGKDCLLTYTQNMYSGGNGGYSTSYQYEVLRFDAQGNKQSVDSQYVCVSDGQQDATELSGLMEALRKYLVKIIVVRDPYALTGQTWAQNSDIAYGTTPEEETDTPQEEGTLGFVQIQDPSSWLHLREGPGTEYDRVLADPADPESFVRQALGSPVTVLETVETGDSENPVWVKIRIRYHDREFIGYSSKTYIRLQDEN